MRAMFLFVALSTVCFGEDPSRTPDSDAERTTKIYSEYRSYRKFFPKVLDITPFKLDKIIEKGDAVVIVDVRRKKEMKVSMIPGAITRKEFEKRREGFKDSLVVAYCTIGFRSGRYADKLGDDGFRVRNLAGGILLWAHQVGTLTHEGRPTKRLHTFGKKWDLAPLAFEGVR